MSRIFSNDLLGEDYRGEFTKFFEDSSNQKRSNGVTWHTVRTMNAEMVRKNVPMTQAHYETATNSIRRGDPICQFLKAENQHVLDSQGSGFVYNAGYVFHSGIAKVNKLFGSN